jgi:thymidylate kinase
MLITLEGLPGAGKTTQAALLAQCLRHHGHDVTTLPDLATLDTEPIAATIIELLASTGDPYLRSGDAITDTLLTAAIRADIVATILDPALTATPHGIVIEDRGIHTMASYAIASLLRDHRATTEVALAWIQSLIALTGPRPSRALWLSLPPKTAALRTAKRENQDTITPEHQSYLNWVNLAYTLLAEHDPQLAVINTTGLGPEQVHQLIHHAISTPPGESGPMFDDCAGLSPLPCSVS